MLTILGLDPGFENLGYAAVSVVSDAQGVPLPTVLDAGLIRTKPLAKKRGSLVAEDNHRRIREQREALVRVLDTHRVTVVTTEYTIFINNSAAMYRLGLVNGSILGLVEERKLVLAQQATQDIKAHVGGRSDLSKEDVMAAVDKLVGYTLSARFFPAVTSKEDRTHPYDACAAAFAALRLDVIRLYLRGGR